ncbi:MAG: ATP-binding protein [Spirochaetia bacterium]|nr:ATP-binding protein [Spirochaetia bacterium]
MNESGNLNITAQTQGSFVSLRIRDTGPGIPAENLTRIFEPLYTTKAKGIGLGLAVSRKLMLLNGGDLKVQSQEGEGTEFTMIVPCGESKEA